MTRVGDTAMLIGLFLLFASLGTLDIQEMAAAAEVTENTALYDLEDDHHKNAPRVRRLKKVSFPVAALPWFAA